MVDGRATCACLLLAVDCEGWLEAGAYRVTLAVLATAPLGPSPVTVTSDSGTSNALVFDVVAPPATPFLAQQSVGVATGGTASAAVLPSMLG